MEFPWEVCFEQLFVVLVSGERRGHNVHPNLSHGFLPSGNPDLSWKALTQILLMGASVFLVALVPAWVFFLKFNPCLIQLLIAEPNIGSEAGSCWYFCTAARSADVSARPCWNLLKALEGFWWSGGTSTTSTLIHVALHAWI